MGKRESKKILRFTLFFLTTVCLIINSLHSRQIGTEEAYTDFLENIWINISPQMDRSFALLSAQQSAIWSKPTMPTARKNLFAITKENLKKHFSFEKLDDSQLFAFLSGIYKFKHQLIVTAQARFRTIAPNFQKEVYKTPENYAIGVNNFEYFIKSGFPRWCACKEAPVPQRIFLLFSLLEKITTQFPPNINIGKNITITSLGSGGAALELLITISLLSLGYNVILNLIDIDYIEKEKEKGLAATIPSVFNTVLAHEFFREIFNPYSPTINLFSSTDEYSHHLTETRERIDILLLVDPGQNTYLPEKLLAPNDENILNPSVHGIICSSKDKQFYFYFPYTPEGEKIKYKIFCSRNLIAIEQTQIKKIITALSLIPTNKKNEAISAITVRIPILLNSPSTTWKTQLCPHNAFVEFQGIIDRAIIINAAQEDRRDQKAPFVFELSMGKLTDSFVDYTQDQMAKVSKFSPFDSLESSLILLKEKLLELARRLTEPVR